MEAISCNESEEIRKLQEELRVTKEWGERGYRNAVDAVNRHVVTMHELISARDTIEFLTKEHLPRPLLDDEARLDHMWQQMVLERDRLRNQVHEAQETIKGLMNKIEKEIGEDREEVLRLSQLNGWMNEKLDFVMNIPGVEEAWKEHLASCVDTNL